MIKYTLKCDQDHRFESWFKSSGAYEALERSKHLSCPVCGSQNVSKALMAPNVAAENQQSAQVPAKPGPDHASAMQELKAKIEADSEYVGSRFAEEARNIHLGDAPERAIYGEARPADAKALVEDGIPVAPLPFMPTRKAN
ncbi:MAG: DUF1178 family protein [Pseudomonadota bacterium]